MQRRLAAEPRRRSFREEIAMFEAFDHTADIGLRIRADSLNALFAEAGRALTSLLVEDIDSVHAVDKAEIAVEGTEHDYLLFDWLNELLFQFETDGRLFSRFEVSISETGLHATAYGEVVDPQRHQLSHEVKAITYHHLKVEQTPAGWFAEVILDI